MWFDIRGTQLRFSINEFALITGLECHQYPKITRGEIRGNRILAQFFLTFKTVNRERLDAAFHSCNSSNDEDCVKLAQLYLLGNMLLAKEKHKLIDLEHLKLVDNPAIFNNYPWGRVCYSFSLGFLQRALANRIPKFREKPKKNPDHQSETYHLAGFPFALQVWACESIPPLCKFFAENKGSNMPRILNWGDTQQPNWKTVQKLVFAQDELEVVVLKPTKLERTADYLHKVVKKKKPDKDHPKAMMRAIQILLLNEEVLILNLDEIRGVLTSLKDEIIKINGQVASLIVGRVEMGQQLANVVNTLSGMQSELKIGENGFKIHHQKRKTLESIKDKGVHAVEVEEDDDDDDGDNYDDDTARENENDDDDFEQPVIMGGENERDKLQYDFEQPVIMGGRGSQMSSFSSFVDYALHYAEDKSQDKQRDNADDTKKERGKK